LPVNKKALVCQHVRVFFRDRSEIAILQRCRTGLIEFLGKIDLCYGRTARHRDLFLEHPHMMQPNNGTKRIIGLK
jgi:hypothetical protein